MAAPPGDREAALAAIAAQLSDVVASLQALPPAGAEVPPGPAPGLTRVQSFGSTASDTDNEVRAKARPSFYPHMPQRRKALLDGIGSRTPNEILDALKLDDYSGFYNLSMLLLGFSLIYMVLRNVSQHGLQMRLEHFTCPEQTRDALTVASILTCCMAASFLVFAALRARVNEVISQAAYLLVYSLVQLALLAGPIAALYSTPTGPLSSAVTLMAVIVLCLKLHSYVATNLAMAAERASGLSTDGSEGEGEEEVETDDDGAPLHSSPHALTFPAQGPSTDQGGSSGSTLSRSARARRRRRRRRAGADQPPPAAVQEVVPGSLQVTDSATGVTQTYPGVEAREGVVPPPPAPPSLDHLQPYSAASVDGSELAPHPRAENRRRRQLHVRRFPRNVTAGNFAYFLVAPTLVYEPSYPRTRRVRCRFITGHAVAMGLCSVAQYFLLTQFLLPVLGAPPEGRSLVLDLMKLAVPSMALWLAGFLGLFHCWLNIVGEVTRFGDRAFYKAWYNSSSVAVFWRDWNTAVHEWCLRHAYIDLVRFGNVPKQVALLGTFLLSALLHEVIFSVAFKTLRGWFFGGMLLQIPLIAVSEGLRGTRRGNLVVWLSLFLGQPLLELLYIREFLAANDGHFFCLPSPAE